MHPLNFAYGWILCSQIFADLRGSALGCFFDYVLVSG